MPAYCFLKCITFPGFLEFTISEPTPMDTLNRRYLEELRHAHRFPEFVTCIVKINNLLVKLFMSNTHWNEVYAKTGPHPWSGVDDWLSDLMSRYHPSPKKALDIGTGEGDKAFWLASQGYQVTGIDISDIAISKAQTQAPKDAPVTFKTMDIADLGQAGFKPGSFGIVLDLLSSQFIKSDRQTEYFEALSGLISRQGIVVYTFLEATGNKAPAWAKGLGIRPESLGSTLGHAFKVLESGVRPAQNLEDTNVHRVVLSSTA
ncbi:MAG: class I SAM-dependent methyltransferase [Patescibacteria group bacterium]